MDDPTRQGTRKKEQPDATIPSPADLLPKRGPRLTKGRREAVINALSAYNYKVEASLGSSFAKPTPALCVFDTGAGPNIVRANVLPPEALESLAKASDKTRLVSASSDELTVLGTILLMVKVGQYSCRQPFVVVRSLTSDAILGTTFIDRHVENIWI